MSSSDRTYREAPGLLRDAGPADPAPAGTGEWLARAPTARGRHTAITRNLNTWSSYKRWSDQVRGAWDKK